MLVYQVALVYREQLGIKAILDVLAVVVQTVLKASWDHQVKMDCPEYRDLKDSKVVANQWNLQ